MNENEELQAFHDNMLEVEQKLIDLGVANATSWFKLPKNKVSTDVIQSKFGSTVKVSRDKETGEPDGKYPTIKIKVGCKDNVWEPKLYNMNTKEQYKLNGDDDINDILVKNARVKCIITCVGLWVASGNYMCQWKLVKAEVDVPESSFNEFLPDSDDEEVMLQSLRC